jgi:hypothetical protein
METDRGGDALNFATSAYSRPSGLWLLGPCFCSWESSLWELAQSDSIS